MGKTPELSDIKIRSERKAGDLNYIIYMHQMTYDFGHIFQSRVAKSVTECYMNFSADRERVWIAEYNEERKGCLILQDDDGAARFGYFIIDQSCRGIGLGRQMIDLFMNFAKDVCYKKSFLYTHDDLLPARHLYESYGYKHVATEDLPYGRDAMRYELEF